MLDAPDTSDSGTTATHPGSPTGRAAPPMWLVVAVACAGQFLVVLDVSVVNVALPSMRTDLGLSASGLQWVVNAYSIAFAGFMLLGGRAGDVFGRKRVFVTGVLLFTLASLGGGLAQEGWQLLVARLVQGLGAAVLAPSTLTLLTSAVPEGAARARAVATWTAVGAGGGAAGGLVGGVLTDGLSWRWVLLINVPVGAVVAAAAVRWIRETAVTRDRRLDVPGAVLVTAAAAVLAYGIVQTEATGWTSAATLVPLAAGLLLLALFLLAQHRSKEPLMPLRVLAVRSVAAANAAMFVCGAGMVSMWYFMTLYAQNVLGYTPLGAGLALIPSSVSVLVGAKTAPRLMRWAGAKSVAVLGTLVAAAGFAWQSTMGPHGAYVTSIMLPGILMMLGAGLSGTPLASLATSGADPGDAGLVSGLVNTSRTLGGALGLAVLSTVAASRSAGASDPAALSAGYAAAFGWGAGILVVAAALTACWLRGERAGRTAGAK
ncbi:MFS transporter [Streptomyces sp. NPDC059740]|uniref:MFS transporter n=1 Tax=Streptomyces sp. NPDC059740 TaxID=3346926 RepID=UPI00365DF866